MSERMYRVRHTEDGGCVLLNEPRDEYFPLGKYFESEKWFATAEEAWSHCARTLSQKLLRTRQTLDDIRALVD